MPRPVGTIVLHVAVVDYRTLPFITSQSPYFELFRPAESGAPRRRHARQRRRRRDLRLGPCTDLHVRRRPRGRSPSALPAHLRSRRAAVLGGRSRAGDTYRVYFSNDRVGIYAIGYPALTLFDHLVHLAELTHAGGRGVRRSCSSGHGDLHPREPRASARRARAAARDSRQLLPQAVPRVRARVDHPGADAGARDPRLLRRSAARRRRRPKRRARRRSRSASSRSRTRCSAAAPEGRRAGERRRDGLDQPGHRSGRQHLRRRRAASRRASAICSRPGLLPTRTPDDVYRAIVLERLPSFVDEDRIGAMPLHRSPRRRSAPADETLILTVPLANRQRDIEREIDDLDRGVHLASLLLRPARRRRSGCRWPSGSPIRSAG